jgi:precorrin-2/cobalt-factor-2 C20-methyltransferase
MSHDPERLRPAWQAAADALAPQLEAGQDVAFATEGDPSLYSTFTYVRRELLARLPSLRVEVVPGISSVMTVPAVSGMPLADGEERIAIVPAAYEADLEPILTRFDTTVLMKIGPAMPHVVDTIERLGLLDRAIYVSKASMEEQRVERDIRVVRETRGDCFAMIVVARKERSGRLERAGFAQEDPA